MRTTIAGGPRAVDLGDLGTPRQTTTDSYGNLFVADSTTSRIVEVTAAGITTNLVTRLSAPQGVVADLLGNLYIADTGNNRLVYLSPLTGNQRVIAVSGFTLSAPIYLALDTAANLYVIDTTTRACSIFRWETFLRPSSCPPEPLRLRWPSTPEAISISPTVSVDPGR